MKNFPRQGAEQSLLEAAAKQVVEIHGKPLHTMNSEEHMIHAGIEGREHTGIELSGAEMIYVQKIVSDKMEALKDDIASVKRSIHDRKAANPRNAEEEIQALEKELDFLEGDLGKKLFEKK